jgi:hypothetical protein
MIDLKQLQQDFADDQRRSASMSRYLRHLADLYELHGSVELVAQHLSNELDGSGDPRTAKLLVEHIRKGMFRLLLTIQLGWKERQIMGGHDGN